MSTESARVAPEKRLSNRESKVSCRSLGTVLWECNFASEKRPPIKRQFLWVTLKWTLVPFTGKPVPVYVKCP